MAATPSDPNVTAARLLERLLADADFRARFRRDPASACREAGLDELAREMSMSGGNAMATLDGRVALNGLAGVMIAASMEAFGIYELTQLGHHLPDVGNVISHVNLPAIGHHPKGGGGGAAALGGNGTAAPADAPSGAGALPADAPAGGDAGAAPSGGGGGAGALPTDPPAGGSGSAADATTSAADGKGAAGATGDVATTKPSKSSIARRAARLLGGSGSAKKSPGDSLPSSSTLPSSSDLPTGGNATPAATASNVLPGDTPAAQVAAPANVLPGDTPAAQGAAPANALPGDVPPTPGAAPAGNVLPGDAPNAQGAVQPEVPAPNNAPPPLPTDTPGAGHAAAVVEPTPQHHAIDPTQFGGEGHGGTPDPEALALLKNKNIVLDPDGIADIKAGRIDPRVVGVLTKLGSEHKIVISCMCSDHAKFTAGGSVSNHHFGRGADIASIDGETVGPGSPLAREVASELSQLEPDIRPNEIGSPFAIAGPGYFTDAAHQNHIHVGFKQEIPADWKPPADVAAPGDPTTTAAPVEPTASASVAPPTTAPVVETPAPQPGTPPVPAPPPPNVHQSQVFHAVQAKTAAAGKPNRGDSGMFLKVDEPKATAAQVQPGTPGVADLVAHVSNAPDTYPGDDAPQAEIAAWMAGQAEKRGLPPELPLMASLVESGMKNVHYGDADSLGFFQMRVGTWNSGAYQGFADKPELQVKWFLDQAETVKQARIASGQPIDDPKHYGDWIADVERPAAQYRFRYQTKLDQAQDLLAQRQKAAPPVEVPQPTTPPVQAPQGGAAALVENASAPVGAGDGSPLGAAALALGTKQLGVHEIGSSNTGTMVDQFLKAGGVAPGNPWCASFVTWSLEQAGHKMPGSGWAGVATWVQNAKSGSNGLHFVSAADARPGDIVAYDWGGQDDFGSDGHIGFLASQVKDGQFKALEGNNADAVNSVDRHLGGGPNIVFIRIDGNPKAGAGVLDPTAATGGTAPAPTGPPPLDPAQFGPTGTGGPASAEGVALLSNQNVQLDPYAVADIKAGRVDPRLIGILTKLGSEHRVSASLNDGALDITTIDGENVSPDSPLARAVASEISGLEADIRPSQIGSPFAIAGDGYVTDPDHPDRIHLAFDKPIDPSWKPPADVAATPPVTAPGAPQQTPVVATAAQVQPGTPQPAPVTPPAPVENVHQSQIFHAVQAKTSSAGKPSRGDSGMFLKVDEPKATAAQVQPGAPPVQPGAPQVQPGGAPVVDAAAQVAAAAPDAYPGDNATQDQIAAWMAGQAQKRGLPAQLPVMASLVESGMKNLNYGDRDSVGFFQMRTGIWNQGAYAGFDKDPKLQVKWFLDQAEAVKKERIAAGKSIDDPKQYGEWIADVERCAAEYRGRYQTKLDQANDLLGSAGTHPSAPAPVVDPTVAAVASNVSVGSGQLPADVLKPLQDAIAQGNAPGPKALAAIQEASKYVNTPYKWGGSTPQTGFDCSGLMQWAYAQSGVQIPRVTYTQIEAGLAVDRAHLKPGDLVFFAANGDVHHVGMYLGDDKFLHAPHTGDVVKVSSLDEPYYAQQFDGGRRFDQAAGVAAVPGAAAQAPVPAPGAVAPVASAASVQPPATAPAVDPTEVAKANAAVARDAAEVRRNQSQLFRAISAVEAKKDSERERHASAMFLKAIDPSQVKRPQAVAASVTPNAPAPAAVTPPPDPTAAVAAPSVDLTDAAAGYPGDNASQAELAKWLAAQAQKSGLPPELPVMASLVESGVKNLNYGDRDSVGFFQMRTGIWDKGDYAGYQTKPELQAKWFIDQALAVKRAAIAKGDANFGTDPATYGKWVADVEQCQEDLRFKYQDRLDEARSLLST